MTGNASPISGLERRLTLRQLRAISSIAESGQILGAATALGLSQPALTRTLRELENLFGVALFLRHPRGVTLTDYGAALTKTARQILDQVARLENTINGMVLQEEGALAIGSLPSASGLMAGVLSRLGQTRPWLDVRLFQGRVDQLLPMLSGGGIEVLLGRLYPLKGERGFVRRPLYNEPLGLLVRPGHPLTRVPKPEVDALRRYRLILPTHSQRMSAEVEAWLHDLNIPHSHGVRTSATTAMRELLLSDDNILVLPPLMMAGDLLRGEIVQIPTPVPSPTRLGGVIYRHGVPLSDSARLFLKEVRAQIRNLAETGLITIL